MTDNEGGKLAAALAKAQLAFAPVKRDKKVVVKTKTGGQYEFSYAPLDSILEAVRKPLSDNGLVVVQLLDDGDLVTMLLHDSGERLSGSMALPQTTDIQGLGSAITYLRRYAIQALLGIAAEEDDDGNRSIGNEVGHTPVAALPREDEPDIEGGLIGTVEKGKSPVDLELRPTPDGPAFGFKLKNGRKSYPVLAVGPLAEALSLAGLKPDERVTVWGRMDMVPWDKDGKPMPPYPRIALSKVASADWILPAEEAVSLPLFDEAEQAAILAQELADAEKDARLGAAKDHAGYVE